MNTKNNENNNGDNEETLKQHLIDEERASLNTNTTVLEHNSDKKITDLGKIAVRKESQELNIGYISADPAVLPSKGKYNSADLKIEVRPATLEEIKHYSSMNEQDYADTSDKMYNILERCYNVYSRGSKTSVKVLKENDKLFLLFYLRDVSMAKHQRQNKLYQIVKCPHCNYDNKIEITNDIFSYYDIPSGIMKWYSETERCFVIETEIETIRIYIPSMGVQSRMREFIYEQEMNKRKNEGGYYNANFLTYLQFLVEDYTLLTNQFIDAEHRRYQSWDFDKHEVIRYITEKINYGIKPSVTFPCESNDCKKDITSVLRFPRGVRNIFNLSTLPERLFES